MEEHDLSITRAEMLADIAALLTDNGRPDGEGWYTLAEIAAEVGRKPDGIRDRIAKLVRNGRLEKRQASGNRPVYYRKVGQ